MYIIINRELPNVFMERVTYVGETSNKTSVYWLDSLSKLIETIPQSEQPSYGFTPIQVTYKGTKQSMLEVDYTQPKLKLVEDI